MIRRPPRSTRTTHSFPTRRSSDLGADGALFDPAAEDYVPPEVAPLFAQPIGIALDATTIFVMLGLPVLAGDGGPFLALNDAGFVERASVRANILLAEDVPAFSVEIGRAHV